LARLRILSSGSTDEISSLALIAAAELETRWFPILLKASMVPKDAGGLVDGGITEQGGLRISKSEGYVQPSHNQTELCSLWRSPFGITDLGGGRPLLDPNLI
jgi:hypothetical protein